MCGRRPGPAGSRSPSAGSNPLPAAGWAFYRDNFLFGINPSFAGGWWGGERVLFVAIPFDLVGDSPTARHCALHSERLAHSLVCCFVTDLGMLPLLLVSLGFALFATEVMHLSGTQPSSMLRRAAAAASKRLSPREPAQNPDFFIYENKCT